MVTTVALIAEQHVGTILTSKADLAHLLFLAVGCRLCARVWVNVDVWAHAFPSSCSHRCDRAGAELQRNFR